MDENTVILKFYLSPRDGIEIQDVGLRPLVVSNLLSCGFTRGNAQNLDDGRVVVALEGNPSAIIAFRNYIAKRLESECKKDYSMIPCGIGVSEIRNIDNPAPVQIYDLSQLASSLMLEETSRGVGAISKRASVQWEHRVQGYGGRVQGYELRNEVDGH